MDFVLDPVEVRVLGALVEKALTTPDYYPLSLSGLTGACNQKSNREPVMDLDEATVLEALNGLMKKHLVVERGGSGSRVRKYAHRLSDTLTRTYDFSREEIALLSVLMLRQAQTLGELRTRTTRLAAFDSLEAVERTLQGLASRTDGPYVQELPRQPGQRERRFMHLLAGSEFAAAAAPAVIAVEKESLEARVAALEETVAALQRELAELRGGFGAAD